MYARPSNCTTGPPMSSAALAAARLGLILWTPPRSILDGLDILAELGGEATVGEVLDHVGAASWSNAYQRLDTLAARGLVEVIEGRPRRYRLTRAGRLLRTKAA